MTHEQKPDRRPRSGARMWIHVIMTLLTFGTLRPRLKWTVLPLAVLLGGAAVFGIGTLASDELRLQRDGIEVEGVITDKQIERRQSENGGSVRYVVYYQFDARLGDRPTPYEGSQRVCSAFFESYEIGDPVKVTFLYDDPDFSRVDVADAIQNALMFFGMSMICAGLMAALFLLNIALAIWRLLLRRA